MKTKRNTPKLKEEAIENQILYYLESQGVSVEKINSEGHFNQDKGFYQKRKTKYSRSGTSDIHGTIPPYGRGLFIEVKRPDTISFFDRPVSELAERLVQAQYDRKVSKASLSRYQHAIDQGKYIEEKLNSGAVAFYASSTDETIKKLQDFGIFITQ